MTDELRVPTDSRRVARRRWVIAAIVLAAPGVVLAPAWRLAGMGIGEDEALYYYPSRVFFGERVSRGDLPEMNPLTGLGRPFAADPQSAVWYPATWAFLLGPPQVVYGVLLWAHYVLAAWGAYRLSRSLGATALAALLAGMVFAFSGFMLAHRAHYAMQNAAAWAPVVVWRMRRAAERGGGAVATAGAAAALQCLAGHAQIAAITALGSLTWTVAEQPRRPAAVLRWVAAWSMAAGLFAVQWVPTALYVRECTRVQNDYWDFTQNSWHPAALVTGVMPMLLGQRLPNVFDRPWWGPSHQTEQFAYVGVIPAVLALATAGVAWRCGGGKRAAVVVGVFGVLLSLGKYGPVCPLLYLVPGSNLLRVPARGLVLVHLSAALLAGIGLHELLMRPSSLNVRLRSRLLAWTRRPVATAAAIVAVCVGAALCGGLMAGGETPGAAWSAVQPWRPAVWAPLVVTVSSLAGLRVAAGDWRRPARAAGLCIAAAGADLSVMGWTLDVPAGWPTLASWLDPSERREWLGPMVEAGGGGRLWVVTDTAGVYHGAIRKGAANTNMLVNVASLSDYGPLQPVVLRDVFRFAPWGVTDRAAELLSDGGWMAAYDVRWILVCLPELPAPRGGALVARTSAGERLYRNDAALGELFVESTDGAAAPVRGHVTDDAATVRVGPGGGATGRRLVFSRVVTGGWRVQVDGEPRPIRTVHGALMAVDLPEASCEVRWEYSTPGLGVGACISVGSAVVAAGVAARAWLARRRGARLTEGGCATG